MESKYALFHGGEIGLRVVGLDRRGRGRGRIVSRCTGRANGKRFLSIWVGVNGFRSPTNTVLSGATIREAALFEMNGGGTRILLRANVLETPLRREGGWRGFSRDIHSGLKHLPSSPSRLRSPGYARPCPTSDWFPSNSNFVLPGTRWIWFFHRISRMAEAGFYFNRET